MKRLLMSVLICLLLICAGACSKQETETQSETAAPETTAEPASTPTPEPTPEPEPEPVETITFTTEGTYSLFGVMNEGMLVESSELQTESDLILEEGGTGSMSFEGDTVAITKWELNGDTVSLTTEDGGEADAKYHDGILDLDLNGNGSMILYYSQEGADISAYEFLTLEEIRQRTSGD